LLSSKIFPLIKRRKLSPNLSGNHESRLISRVTRHCRCQEPRFSGECVYQSRKNYGGNHGRPENKGLGAANEPSLFCTSFMKFRGPEALKDRVERTMVAITADLKTKDLALRMSHRCSALLS